MLRYMIRRLRGMIRMLPSMFRTLGNKIRIDWKGCAPGRRARPWVKGGHPWVKGAWWELTDSA
jgi:hypothetical protein